MKKPILQFGKKQILVNHALISCFISSVRSTTLHQLLGTGALNQLRSRVLSRVRSLMVDCWKE